MTQQVKVQGHGNIFQFTVYHQKPRGVLFRELALAYWLTLT